MMNRQQMVTYLRENVSLVDFVNGNFNLPVGTLKLGETHWAVQTKAGITKVWCKKMGSPIEELDLYITAKGKNISEKQQEWNLKTEERRLNTEQKMRNAEY